MKRGPSQRSGNSRIFREEAWKKNLASTGFKPVSLTLQRRIVKEVKREVFQGVPMSTRTMKERDDELLEVTCD